VSDFTKKIIQVTFTLHSKTFAGSGGSNTLTISGLKTSFVMTQAGGIARDAVSLVIYGLTPSQLNDLATYGMPPDSQFNNKISVSAGDSSGLSLVYAGDIIDAYADYDGAPETSFAVTALVGAYLGVAPTPAVSYSGTVDAATIMGNIATLMNLTLENSGVNVKISNPYLSGSLFDQAKQVAKAGDFFATLDTVRHVLAIWPKKGARDGALTLIAPPPQGGLVGYPKFTMGGVIFRTVFNPNIVFGREIQLQSSLQHACGKWVPMTVRTELATETPGGPWFQDVVAFSKTFSATGVAS
jgi:hypothetical protein